MCRWLERSPESFTQPSDDGSLSGPWRPANGGGVLRFDTRAFYAALDEERQRRGLDWTALAGTLGVALSALTRLRLGGRAHFPWILRPLAWLRRPSTDFVLLTPIVRSRQ
jgi:hypothetical protein